MNRFALVLVAWLACLPTANGAEPASPRKTVRLLTIGNSFSANATAYLKDLVKAAGNELIHDSITVGGASLELHATRAQLHEKDPQDPKGTYTGGLGLKEHLTADRWDFVTIQQSSFFSHDIDLYRPHAAWLQKYVKQHAPSAELLVHHVWPYRRDDPWFLGKTTKPGQPTSLEAMYRICKKNYETIAAELGVRRIPTGDAFYLADTDPDWGYQVDPKFDPQKAKRGELPDQKHSLHVGWYWRTDSKGKTSLGFDGHHASTAGKYLGACVFFEMLFDESVVDNTFVPGGITPDDARFLRATAHRAVAEAEAGQAKTAK